MWENCFHSMAEEVIGEQAPAGCRPERRKKYWKKL